MFKVRASGGGQIMTDPSTKKAKEAGELGATCRKYVRNQWVMDTYGREKDLNSRPIMKGLLNEEQGITMLSTHLGEMLTKNEKWHQDDFKTGTPDLILEDTVYDIKCSYDIFTFANADLSNDYDWQLQIYMDLLGLEKAALVYVLTDTPLSIIQAEVKSICWKLQDDSEAEMIEAELIKQMTYPDIAQEDRIKIIPVTFDPERITALHARVEQCRAFYDSLKLNT